MNIKYIHILLLLIFVGFSSNSWAQLSSSGTIPEYSKKEINSGIVYDFNSEREELRTDISREFEKSSKGNLSYNFGTNYWKFLDYKQERVSFNLMLGPVHGSGNLIDSTDQHNISADYSLLGLQAGADFDFSTRYYYNNRNYTIVEFYGWGYYQWFKRNSNGTVVDSLGISEKYDDKINDTKLRYGFTAKAGWGYGRLNAMNNYMLVDYLLDKYYKGRNFSHQEKIAIATEVQRIKSQRSLRTENKTDVEAELLNDYFNNQLLLTKIENLESNWKLGEFKPRLDGSRLEFGPFFRYFNREPDFIYGGYIQFEYSKYTNYKWNRNFAVQLSYNGYKRNDWAKASLKFGWSYYKDLKSQFDFGIQYVPAANVNTFEDLGSINHGIIPYFGYYSQLNSKTRVELDFAYRISEDENLMISGPEFSVSFYRSRY